jgi:hypothetical protein
VFSLRIALDETTDSVRLGLGAGLGADGEMGSGFRATFGREGPGNVKVGAASTDGESRVGARS